MAGLPLHAGRNGEAMMALLEEVAVLFRSVGVGRQTPLARLSVLIGLVDDLRQDMQRLLRDSGPNGSPEAEIVEATAGLTLLAARATLHAARALLANIPMLLQRWSADPDTIGRQVARPEWLLDGWERISLLWRTGDERIDQKATLAEMVALVPTIPREAGDWVGHDLDLEHGVLRSRRNVILGEDWRTGVTVTDLVARNERLRALSPGGPA